MNLALNQNDLRLRKPILEKNFGHQKRNKNPLTYPSLVSRIFGKAFWYHKKRKRKLRRNSRGSIHFEFFILNPFNLNSFNIERISRQGTVGRAFASWALLAEPHRTEWGINGFAGSAVAIFLAKLIPNVSSPDETGTPFEKKFKFKSISNHLNKIAVKFS